MVEVSINFNKFGFKCISILCCPQVFGKSVPQMWIIVTEGFLTMAFSSDFRVNLKNLDLKTF